MGLVKDFRDFAMRGNVVDLAVGVIIGAAFKGIIDSVVADIIMPPVGKAVGNMDFSNLYIPLYHLPPGVEAPKTLAKAKELGSVIAYGNFITITINFLIVAFCIFMVVKAISLMQKRFEKEKIAAEAAAPPPDVVLLTEIRDLLKQKAV